MECVVLALDAGVLDHASRVGLQSGHGAANVGVYFYYLFDGRGDKEGGSDALFNAEEDAVRGCDLDGAVVRGGFEEGRGFGGRD